MTLFPRYALRVWSRTDAMRAEAHRILDAARAGEPITTQQIAWALRITGDAA